MSYNNDFSHIIIKNQENKYIVDEFIKYYKFIYSNYTNINKTSKEIFYKLNTIKKTIETVSAYTKKIINGSDLAKIKGIGPKTTARIDEIITKGFLSEINEMKKTYETIMELSKIYGIGPVKASQFYEQYNIKSIKDLIKANNNKTITLTHQMELGIKYKDLLNQKIPNELIKKAEIPILNKIKNIPNIITTICGSYRREKPFSSDIDILISHKNITETNNKTGFYLNKVVELLDNYFIIDKLTESSSRHFQGFASFKNIFNKETILIDTDFDYKKSVVRLDIIVVPIQSYYTALMHFTGSTVFNQKMRLHAKSMGMKLSEYGLYDNEEHFIKIKSEQEIFSKLLLKYIPPNKR
jgi:DNA polymerase/3'-5' exonuclease PolX